MGLSYTVQKTLGSFSHARFSTIVIIYLKQSYIFWCSWNTVAAMLLTENTAKLPKISLGTAL